MVVVLRRVPVFLVGTVPELRVHGREDLLGGRRDPRVRQAVVVFVIVFVEDSVLGRGRD